MIITKPLFRAVLPLLVLPVLVACSSEVKREDLQTITRHRASEMEQLAHVGNVWISEQPTREDLIWMRDNAVTMVIDTRGRTEDRGFDERAFVVSLGMRYHLMPLEADQDFVIRYFDQARNILATRKDVPTLIHGESANRAAAVWMVYRVLDDGVAYDVALAEAEIAGLRSEATLKLVQQYLMANGVRMDDPDAGLAGAAPMTSEPGPDEVTHRPAEAATTEDDTTGDAGEAEAEAGSDGDSRLD